jgi:hypothetical protein
VEEERDGRDDDKDAKDGSGVKGELEGEENKEEEGGSEEVDRGEGVENEEDGVEEEDDDEGEDDAADDSTFCLSSVSSRART